MSVGRWVLQGVLWRSTPSLRDNEWELTIGGRILGTKELYVEGHEVGRTGHKIK